MDASDNISDINPTVFASEVEAAEDEMSEEACPERLVVSDRGRNVRGSMP